MRPSLARAARRSASAVALLSWFALVDCKGCDRNDGGRTRKPTTAQAECTEEADCANDNPCTEARCIDGRCTTSYVAEGASCENGSVCDGVSTCDGMGRCVAGPPPNLDDGNPCTLDACDPVRGPTHEPVPVDDFNPCTLDACDARTGFITHEPVDVDDGDDCTFDSCDPQSGVKHQPIAAFHSCEASCGSGFHAASKTASARCPGPQGISTLCSPDCGASFYACDNRCPERYHATSKSAGECGPTAVPRIFCEKDGGDSFHSCDERCPAGYQKKAETPNKRCGSDTATSILCTKS